MRWFQIVNEGRDAYIYHGTDINSACHIVADGKIAGGQHYAHHPVGVSLTRDYITALDFGRYWEREFPVVFVFDQQALVRSNLKIFPRRDTDDQQQPRAREAEEMVVGDLPLEPYLVSINIPLGALADARNAASGEAYREYLQGEGWDELTKRRWQANVAKLMKHPKLNRFVPRIDQSRRVRQDKEFGNPLSEAPIADYQFIDRSAEPHPLGTMTTGEPIMTGDSFPPEDLRAIRNPKWQAKLVGQFGKSIAAINLYVMNAGTFHHHDTRVTTVGPIENDDFATPKGGVTYIHQWGGTYDPGDFKKTFGFLPPDYEKCLNVVLTNNWGDERVPFTPWIVAHRVIHALAQSRTNRLKGPHFFPMEEAFDELRLLVNCASRSYFHSRDHTRNPLTWSDEDMLDFYEAFGTFASARNRKIIRQGEFFVDIATQTLLFGKPKFNLDWCTDERDRKAIDKQTYKFQLAFDEALYRATGVLIVF